KIGGIFRINEFGLYIETSNLSEGEKPEESGWQLTAQLPPGEVIPLSNITEKFFENINIDFPGEILPDISELVITINTGKKLYKFAGKFEWNFEIGNMPINAFASLYLEYDKAQDPAVFTGFITAGVSLDSLGIDVSLTYAFGKTSKEFIFEWDDFTASYLIEEGTNDSKKQKYLIFRLEDKSFVDIFNFLVKPINELYGLNIALPDFLSFLDFIKLKEMKINLDDKTIEVECGIDKEIIPGLVRIDSIIIISKKVAGKRKLFCNFVGKFLEQEYPKGNPYEWDVVDGKPPATTPKKPPLELRYLGVGQHVALEGTFKRIEEALTALRKSVQPVGDMASSPLEQTQGLVFSSDSNWLIGADLTLIDTVTIKAIFNDPDLYGIYIAL
ncbi:MAG: hypothetical protein JSW07_11585, partial [bacterium]